MKIGTISVLFPTLALLTGCPSDDTSATGDDDGTTTTGNGGDTMDDGGNTVPTTLTNGADSTSDDGGMTTDDGGMTTDDGGMTTDDGGSSSSDDGGSSSSDDGGSSSSDDGGSSSSDDGGSSSSDDGGSSSSGGGDLCSDGILNQDETDVDCGNICGATCPIDDTCDSGDDCLTEFCDAALTCQIGAVDLTCGANCEVLADFNGGPGMLDGWTVDDLFAGGSDAVGWTTNTLVDDNGDVRANFTTADGEAAHVDTDAFAASTGADIALVSPVMDVSDGALLVFDHQFRSLNAGDFGHVEVSMDGVIWSNLQTFPDDTGMIPVFPYTADVDGGEQVVLSLAGFESATTQVRFRYEAGGWDWWWQVDDIWLISAP